MLNWLVASVLAVALAAPATARATKYNADVMQLCDLAVAQTKPFGGPIWDRFQEMMMGSCLQNGGTMPGSVANEASSLRPHAAACSYGGFEDVGCRRSKAW
jgi:hypothetical protein